MKLALVHDYLTQYGGAERVLQAFEDVFPKSPIYTLLYDEKTMKDFFRPDKIKTSFMQRLPFAAGHHRGFLLFMPMAIEQFDFSKYNVVVSDSASYAKGVITNPETLHICYCHTPLRYAWDDSQKYIKEFPVSRLIKSVLPILMSYIRIWDRQASKRVDKFIANSGFVASRIKKYYKKDAHVIYPPVDVSFFDNNEKPGDYFLMVGRLISYKKFDLGIRAFNKLGLPLKIVGSGPELKKLKKISADNIEFLGELRGEDVKKVYAGSRALIFPQEEDFGLVSVESMAAGRPIIAFKAGGALEIIKEGVSGVFFDEQTEESLVGAVKKFENMKFDASIIKREAKKFDKEEFKKKIKDFVDKSYAEHIRAINS